MWSTIMTLQQTYSHFISLSLRKNENHKLFVAQVYKISLKLNGFPSNIVARPSLVWLKTREIVPSTKSTTLHPLKSFQSENRNQCPGWVPTWLPKRLPRSFMERPFLCGNGGGEGQGCTSPTNRRVLQTALAVPRWQQRAVGEARKHLHLRSGRRRRWRSSKSGRSGATSGAGKIEKRYQCVLSGPKPNR